MKLTDYNRIQLFAFFLTASLLYIAGCKGNEGKKLQDTIDSISVAHVSDSRIGICNLIISTSADRKIIISGETTDPSVRDDLFNTLDKEGIKFIDSILFLPDTISNKLFQGLVTLSVTNLRKEPDHASELVSQARLGTPVTILKSEGAWLLIQTPDKYIAWTEGSSVTKMTTTEIKAWNRSERVIYLENTGWIFASRGNEGVISDVVAGSILQNAGESGGFVKVALPDGRTGYLPSGSLMDFTNWKYAQSVNTDDICIRAASMLGIPYLWGGTSTKGADCSGYVQTVYFLNGYILQRDASLQALHGESIDLSDNFKNLLPGDLLFFGPTRNGKPRVTHVGIYKGSMEYIHSSGMVNINSLDSSKANFSGPRLKLLLMAKRIVGASTGEGIVAVKDHPLY